MSVQRLVCAYCAGIVAEGRCAVCRAAREQLARERQRLMRVVTACAAAMALLVIMLVAQRSFA